MSSLRDVARNAAASNIFQMMASEEKSAQAVNQIKNMSDHDLDRMADLSGIPTKHREVYRQLMRGEDNEFVLGLQGFVSKLETGDVILMRGTSTSSKVLANSQKAVYLKARSSHVAVVHSDFICIDAIPDEGVSNRLVSGVLAEAENDWRVIRFNNISKNDRDEMLKVCAHYLEQPYKIFPKRRPAKKYSYCSELARKIYTDCNIKGSDIPKHSIVKPCDFDRIADQGKSWTDITAQVRPYVDFCIQYEPIARVASKLFIDGLKLNRARYEERKLWRISIIKARKDGKIDADKARTLLKQIDEAEQSMSFNFWDSNVNSR